MSVTISFTFKDQATAIAGLNAVMASQGLPEETSHINVADMKSKRGRPAKKAKPEVEETEDFEDEVSDEEVEEDEELELEDDETEEEEVVPAPKAKKAAKGPTLDDVINGFKACAQKHGRERTSKILKQFKSKSTRDIAATDYPAVLKLLAK